MLEIMEVMNWKWVVGSVSVNVSSIVISPANLHMKIRKCVIFPKNDRYVCVWIFVVFHVPFSILILAKRGITSKLLFARETQYVNKCRAICFVCVNDKRAAKQCRVFFFRFFFFLLFRNWTKSSLYLQSDILLFCNLSF